MFDCFTKRFSDIKVTTDSHQDVGNLTREYHRFVQACDQRDVARQLEAESGVSAATPHGFYDELFNMYRCSWLHKTEKIASLKSTAKDLILLIQTGLRTMPGRFGLEILGKVDVSTMCLAANDERFKNALAVLLLKSKQMSDAQSVEAQCRFVNEFLYVAFVAGENQEQKVEPTMERKPASTKSLFDDIFTDDAEIAAKELYSLVEEDQRKDKPTKIRFPNYGFYLHDSIEYVESLIVISEDTRMKISDLDIPVYWLCAIDGVLKFDKFEEIGRPFNSKTLNYYVEPLVPVYQNAAKFAHNYDDDALMRGCRFLCYYALACFKCESWKWK